MSASTGIPVGVGAGGASDVGIELAVATGVGLGGTSVALGGVVPPAPDGEDSTMTVGVEETGTGVSRPPHAKTEAVAINAMAETNKTFRVEAILTYTHRFL